MAHQNDDVEYWERKLKEALSISEYHNIGAVSRSAFRRT